MADPVEPPSEPVMDTQIKKNLIMPTNVRVPAEGLTFEFTFDPLGQPPAPPIDPQTISFDGGAAGPELTGYFDVYSVLTTLNVSSLDAGPQSWIVRETKGDVHGVDYDTRAYKMTVHFANNEDEDGLDIAAVEIFALSGNPISPANDLTNIDAQKTRHGLVFTNTFMPNAGPDSGQNFALAIGKTITNRVNANLNTEFEFTLVLTGPQMADGHVAPQIAFPLEAAIIAESGETTISLPAATSSFKLRDGEVLTIASLPAGSSYTLTEAATDQFAPSARIVSDGGDPVSFPVDAPRAPVGAALTAEGKVGNIGSNTAAFMNDHAFSVPAGLVVSNLPVFGIILGVVGLLLLTSLRSRRRVEQMPVY